MWKDAVEEHELLTLDDADHDQERFLAGETTPVMFASALQNFGVAQLLDLLLDLAPEPSATEGVDGAVREVADDFSAFVFKVQSGMNSAHRDRLAYARVVSGTFERGMVVTHAGTGRPFATKFAQAVFGRETTSVETADPGDIIGFVNAQALRVGDTVYVGDPIEYPPVPTFAPEHFVTASAGDIGRYKQFRRGIEQLDQEGVVQVLRSDLRGDQSPVLAAVGPMQFEVVEDRMTNEFNSPIRLSPLDYQVARRTDAAGAAALAGMRGRRGPPALRRHPPGALRRPVARDGHRPRQPRRHARGAARRRELTGAQEPAAYSSSVTCSSQVTTSPWLVRLLHGHVRHEAAGASRRASAPRRARCSTTSPGRISCDSPPRRGDLADAVGDVEGLALGVAVPRGAGAGGEADVGAADARTARRGCGRRRCRRRR